MLTGIAYLAATTAFWAETQRCLFPRLTTAERLSGSVVLGLTSGAWQILWWMTLFGTADPKEESLTSTTVWTATTLHLMGLAWVTLVHTEGFGRHWLTKQAAGDSPSSAIPMPGDLLRSSWNSTTWALLPAMALFWNLMDSHMAKSDGRGGITTGGNCYSDLPYHLTLSHSFLYGSNSRVFSLFTMENPIFFNDRLQYPIIPDFLTAVFVRGGFSLHYALFVPSYLVAVSFCALLYSFAYRFAVASLSLPLSSSSSDIEAGRSVSHQGLSGSPVIAAVITLYITILCGGDYEFKEPPFWLFFVKDIFMPQRSAMFGYSVTLLSLCSSWTAFDEQRNARLRWKYLEFAGFVGAFAPYLQAHSFIAFLILAASQVFFERFDFKNIFAVSFAQDAAFLLGPALFFGIPQMASFAGGASSWGFAQLSPMWSERRKGGALTWLWECLGFHIIFCILAFKGLSVSQRKKFAPFVVLFIVSTYVKFQPWNVDNMKVFYIAYFGIASVIGSFFSKLFRAHLLFKILVPVLFLLLTIPAMFCIYNEAIHPIRILNRHEVEAAEWVRTNTPYNSLFMLASPPPRHKNTIPTWGGRNVIMGFKGWLQSRELAFDMQERWTRKLVKGDPEALDICYHYGVDYVEVAGSFIGDEWVEGAPVNRTWIKEHLKLVYRGPFNEIYEIQNRNMRLRKDIFGPLRNIGYRRAKN